MSICTQCARIQRTCCEQTTVEVALTRGDIARIAWQTGRSDFYQRQAVRPDQLDSYENPARYGDEVAVYVMGLFDREDRRPILKKQPDGSCLFVSSTGCTLPVASRPLLCRIYPYDWTDSRELWVDAAYCPKALFRDEADLLEQVADPYEVARALVDQLYDELAEGGETR